MHFSTQSEFGFSTTVFLGLAVIALAGFFLGSSFFSNKATMYFVAEGNRFMQLNEEFTVIVAIKSSQPYNTIAAKIQFPADRLEIIRIDREKTFIELWVQEPLFSNADGTVELAGGVTKGYQGRGDVARITFKSKKTGEAIIDFSDASVLAHDGRGTEILGKQRDIAYFIREAGPSADVNDDNQVTIKDLSKVLANMGSADSPYDLNKDGKVNISDISIVLSRILH